MGGHIRNNFITNEVLPLVKAIENNDLFEIARIVKNGSPIINSSRDEYVNDSLKYIKQADENIEKLRPKLISNQMTFRDVLVFLYNYKILELPDLFQVFAQIGYSPDTNESENEHQNDDFTSWGKALQAKIYQVQAYSDYISEKSGFGTHQGVKGLEFDRIMAVLDDESAGGFLFKYEKLLGAEPLSTRDLKNQSEGKDSTPQRTRRLFYVICSRAKKSLTIVAYTKNPEAVKKYATQSWFKEEEVLIF